jgi:tRNA-specific 2-thiouridylase
VGQRRGLGVSAGEPLYVDRIEPSTQTVSLGRREDLRRRGFRAGGFNGFGPEWRSRECLVQFRYRSQPRPARVERGPGDEVVVTLEEPGLGIAPGQSAVFYDGERLLGGARIRETF